MDWGTLSFLLAGCFGLGILHGLIPDEHTWPITFAYSVGTTTGRGGVKSAAWFSTAFTAQRALMSTIVYLALSAAIGFWGFNLATADTAVNGPIYIAVGIAMAVAGFLILTDRIGHFHPFMRVSKNDLARHAKAHDDTKTADGRIPTHWCVVHGFISGFGTDSGILSTWIYITTILLFLVPNHLWYIAWLPGTLFGLGTFLVLMFVGFFFGQTLQVAKRFGPNRIAQFGRLVGARTLLYGGIVFIVFGPVYWVGWFSMNMPFDAGQILVVAVLVGIALPTMLYTWREVRKLPPHLPGGEPHEPADTGPPPGPANA
jgi:sulfite exporter TauE/SafE